MLTTSQKIREAFLTYFKNKGHSIVSSSPLVPGNDPTLLFTNAGMVQFKDVFLGVENRSYTRAVTAQRCVRAGGKHNDLENVGYTARHHTFFEMLGNFSFGDYFKREAIHYAWDFLTKTLAIPHEKLWITVFEEDREAESIWLDEIKISAERFSRCGASSNFWSMGDTGPCGPCTEIFYDHGESVPGGPPGSPDEDGDRYVEIWNIVFMQYERSASGQQTLLPKPSVDTGMGLERIAAVMQGKQNNYDTDLFIPLKQKIKDLYLTSHDPTQAVRWDVDGRVRSNIIADHIRSSAFLITDGVMPSNEGRGYVLRRIIRRAIRHGYKLELPKPFFHQLVAALVDIMGDAYPELKKAQTHVEQVLKTEETLFARTLEKGLEIFNQEVEKILGREVSYERGEQANGETIPGTVVFKLYDTYGFPLDLTADLARELNLSIDFSGFEKAMEEQRQRSQDASCFTADYTKNLNFKETVFNGYDDAALEQEVTVIGLIKEDKLVSSLSPGETGVVILDRTPFYAEGGGQIGDQGSLYQEKMSIEFIVTDTVKKNGIYYHHGLLKSGHLENNLVLRAGVNKKNRLAVALNHSATHLLHAALRKVLGEHVMQKGSLVKADRLRFDFTHLKPMLPTEIQAVELLVNEQIRANLLIDTTVVSFDRAKQEGALAFFGEKYGEQVRVLSMGDFSKELCGGTHVKRTGDIGLFKIISEESIANGIRRLEAVTGEHALHWVNHLEHQLQETAVLFKATRNNLLSAAKKNVQLIKQLEQQLETMQSSLIKFTAEELLKKVKHVEDAAILIEATQILEPKALRALMDKLKDKLNHAIVVLVTIVDQHLQMVIGVTKDMTHRVRANDLAQEIAKHMDLKGGGRADFAQAGGIYTKKLTTVVQVAQDWIEKKLKGC